MDKAFIIIGKRPEFKQSDMVALLFGTEQPTGKQLKGMGFGRITQIDQADTNGDAPTTPTLFLFDRSPAAKEVLVADVLLGKKGKASLGKWKKEQGEPHSIIPQLEGALAQRLLSPRNVLGIKDLRKPDMKSKPQNKRPIRL